VPLDVLNELRTRAILKYSISQAKLGSYVLILSYLRVIDYGTMKELWEPALNLFAGASGDQLKNLVGILKNLPHSIHAHYLSNWGSLWSTLQQQNLLVPADDLVLKHGAKHHGTLESISRSGHISRPTPRDHGSLAALACGGSDRWRDYDDGVIMTMNAFRSPIGRPPGWFGVTPLMIFRGS
jgi:hypothetical protein